MNPAFAQIIQAYLAGGLSLESAARNLLALDPANSGPWTLEMSPRIRHLFAEVHRLKTGKAPPDSWIQPDLERYEHGNLQLLDGVEASFWPALAKREAVRINCRFLAANEEVAYHLAAWFKAADHTVTIEPPDGVDRDEWSILATTNHRAWTREGLREWIMWLRSAPLEGAARIIALGGLPT